MHVSTDHAAHDTTLIAGHAAGDLVGTELFLANRALASCEGCAAVHADLRAIAAATRSLPAPAAAPRDYRIPPEQAERLRRGGLVRRLLRPFAGPASGARPLAAAFSTLGAVGLAVVLLLPAFGGPAALPAFERYSLNAVPAGATPEPDNAPVVGGAEGPTRGSSEGHGDTPATGAPRDQVAPDDGQKQDGGTAAPLNMATVALLGSSGLLAVGLALFALRIIARRLA